MIFTGIFCCVFGAALFDPFSSDREEMSAPVHKWGVWKDGGITKEARREFAPWVVAAGVAAFVGAFLVRDRR